MRILVGTTTFNLTKLVRDAKEFLKIRIDHFSLTQELLGILSVKPNITIHVIYKTKSCDEDLNINFIYNPFISTNIYISENCAIITGVNFSEMVRSQEDIDVKIDAEDPEYKIVCDEFDKLLTRSLDFESKEYITLREIVENAGVYYGKALEKLTKYGLLENGELTKQGRKYIKKDLSSFYVPNNRKNKIFKIITQ